MAEREFKNLPQFVKGIEGRTVTGIAAVFGNVDLGGDRLWLGAFAKTIRERGHKVLHLWNHGSDGFDYFCTPPIAVVRSLREVGRDALPASVFESAPDAVGGLEVAREYLGTPRGDEVFEAIKAGAPIEMSFGYDSIPGKYDFEVVNQREAAETRVRNLREVRLEDTSDVLRGMNPATSVAGKSVENCAALVRRVETVISEFKSGKAEFAEYLLKLRVLLSELPLAGEGPAPATEIKGATGAMDLPLAARDRDWDSDVARGRVRAWAGAEDEPNGDYRKAHFWYDASKPKDFGSYKLPFADVIRGELMAVPKAIFAVAAALQGGRGGVDIPADDAEAVRGKVERYYAKMRREFEDDTILVPWDESKAALTPEPETVQPEERSRADQPSINNFDWRSSLTDKLNQLREIELIT